MSLRRQLGTALLILTAVAQGACNTGVVRDPEFAAVRPRPVLPPEPQGGSMYQAGFNLLLFEDLRARRVGDVLTIVLEEETDAEKIAETSVEKDTSASVANPTVLGSQVQFGTPGFLPLASTSNNTLATEVSSSNSFEGSGESTQSNRLSGQISVTVAEVLPNGDLVVQGEKILTLTEGHEHVRIAGTVRQADIRSDNTVSSSRVANARIEYAGQGGAVASANVIGWLARFFVSAFFPF